MPRLLAALGAGIVFGLGLAISQMVNPAKVLGFLDVAGAWDPTLAVVLVAAVAVAGIAFRVVRVRARPLFADAFQVPSRRDITSRLVGGSALFGIGWGLIGLCPGPAFASLVYGMGESFYFVVALMVGLGLARLLDA